MNRLAVTMTTVLAAACSTSMSATNSTPDDAGPDTGVSAEGQDSGATFTGAGQDGGAAFSGAGQDSGQTSTGQDSGQTSGEDSGTSMGGMDSGSMPDAHHHDSGNQSGGSDSGGGGGADSGGSGTLTPPSQVPSGWKLALDDEFDGNTLGDNWGVGTNLDTFVDNGVTYWNPYQPNEAEYLTSSMVKIQDSNLILSVEASASAISGPYGDKSYIAGYVTSFQKFAFQYGYIEFRAEMPVVAGGAQTGLWPALWLFNSTYSNTDEIDVLESFGADQTAIQMTAQPSNAFNTTITNGGYHIFAVLHDTSTIAFYIDNQLQQSFNQSMSSEMAILMGMQLGSAAFGWLPGPTPSTWSGGVDGPMTADLKVDWVHVWTPE